MPGLGKVSVEKLIAKGVGTSVQLMGEFLCVPSLPISRRPVCACFLARVNVHVALALR